MTRPYTTLALALAAAASLTACQMRADEDAATPGADETPAAAASPTTSAAASIIRDDIAPLEEAELPTEPVELVIGFPDGADIDAAAERALAGLMQSNAITQEDWPVVLAGHTDSAGNDQANLRASRARAEAVAAWLVERGVADGRIEVIAFGEQNPAAPNALPDGSPNEAGRRTNRRVEIRVAPPPEGRDAAESADEDA